MKRNLVLFVGLWASMITGSAPTLAGEVCETLDDCKVLQVNVNARIKKLLSEVKLNLDDLARSSDGKVLHMNQNDAEKYCEEQGSRLPIVRELALISQSFGARGILETLYRNAPADSDVVKTEILRMKEDGYHPIFALNDANEKVVDFYFNEQGRLDPPGNIGKYCIWSKSEVYSVPSFAYLLCGSHIDAFDRRSKESDIGVRCVQSR